MSPFVGTDFEQDNYRVDRAFQSRCNQRDDLEGKCVLIVGWDRLVEARSYCSLEVSDRSHYEKCASV